MGKRMFLRGWGGTFEKKFKIGNVLERKRGGGGGGKTRLMRISRQTFPVQIVRDRKRLENLKSFTYLGSVITKGARCVGEINSRVTMEKGTIHHD